MKRNVKHMLMITLAICMSGCVETEDLLEMNGNQNSAFAKKLIVAAGANNHYSPTVLVYSYYKNPSYNYGQSIVIVNGVSKQAGISRPINSDDVNIELSTDKNITTKKFVIKAVKINNSYYLSVDEKTTTYKAKEVIRDAEIIILNSDNCAKNGWK